MVSSNIQQPNLSLYTKSFAAVSAFDSFQERTVVVFEPDLVVYKDTASTHFLDPYASTSRTNTNTIRPEVIHGLKLDTYPLTIRHGLSKGVL